MTNRKKLVLVPLLIIIASVALYFYLQPKQSANTLRISGNIEATTVNVSFNIAGHIDSIAVQEGDYLKKGALVAQLRPHDLTLKVQAAQAQLAAAQADLKKLQNGSRSQDILTAQAAVHSAQATLTNAQKNYRRMQQLFGQSAIAAQELDQARATYQQAVAALQEAQQKLSLEEAGPRHEDIAASAAQVEQAQKQLKIAEIQLSYAKITAPVAGFVLSKNLESGEYAMAGTPVISMADLENVWLRAYIPETDLGKIHLGEKIAVTTDSYPGKKYYGHITFIAAQAEFTPKNIQTEKERVKLVYRIKITLPNEAFELKPGMPADALIPLNKAGQADE